MPARLAEIVIEEGLIKAPELAKAVDAADAEREPIIVPLVREYGIDEVALVAALKKHIRIKTLDPAKVEFDSDALRELNRDDCRRLRAVPLSLELYGGEPRVLGVAMADPTDTVGIAELEHLSGCVVDPVLVTLSAVEEMIETVYKHAVTEVMPRAALQRGAAEAKGRAKVGKKPKTKPFHRITSEAGPDLQVQAMVKICVDKGLFTQDEYEEVLRTLFKNEKKS